MQIERVLIPTDFSEAGQAAVVRGFEMARQYEAKIHLLHVLRKPPATPMFPITGGAAPDGYYSTYDWTPIESALREELAERDKRFRDLDVDLRDAALASRAVQARRDQARPKRSRGRGLCVKLRADRHDELAQLLPLLRVLPNHDRRVELLVPILDDRHLATPRGLIELLAHRLIFDDVAEHVRQERRTLDQEVDRRHEREQDSQPEAELHQVDVLHRLRGRSLE